MNPDDIEGEEAGDSFVIADEEIKFTPFNMKVSEIKITSSDFLQNKLFNIIGRTGRRTFR